MKRCDAGTTDGDSTSLWPTLVDLAPFWADRFDDQPTAFQGHDIAAMPDRFPSGRY